MRKGFTLIELLIVVAIIGILAAIAVPNFLNAQTKAKISRSYADMDALSKGFITYNLDNNSYPYFGSNFWYSIYIYPALTTPISYMSSIPKDGFTLNKGKEAHRFDGGHEDFYPGWNVYQVRQSGSQWGGAPVTEAVQRGTAMLTVSRGPDQLEDIGGSPATGVLAYHSSNGLNSKGDIYKFTPGSIIFSQQ